MSLRCRRRDYSKIISTNVYNDTPDLSSALIYGLSSAEERGYPSRINYAPVTSVGGGMRRRKVRRSSQRGQCERERESKTRNNEAKEMSRIEEERDTDEPKGEQVQTWPVRKSLTARGQKLPEGLVHVWKRH